MNFLRLWRPFRLLLPFAVVLVFLFNFRTEILDLTGQGVFVTPEAQGSACVCTPPSPFPTKEAPAIRVPNPLGTHKYRSDGLLEVNEEGPHPIYELISNAEAVWNEKLKRASRTLEEAVIEYRRRYRRNPPKGFDTWFKYVTVHDVKLPDEYDQIFSDLEPFWGIEPSDLRKLRTEIEVKKDSYTIGKNDSSEIEVVTYAFAEGRYDNLIVGSREIIALLKDIQEILPAFRMTISPHDVPNRHSDYAVKRAALEAAAAKTYIERAALPKINPIGWISACSPTSPARRKPFNLDHPPPLPSKKTFIYDHHLEMDPCLHPDHFHHHGQFLSHNSGPTPQAAMMPEFSYCSTTIHHDIRIPYSYGWKEDIYPRTDDPPWDEKIDERLLWRGSDTGMAHHSSTRWKNSHRDFLVRNANDLNGMVQVLDPNKTKKESIGKPDSVRKARLNPAVMDVAFVGQPISCSGKVCDIMKEIYPWRSRQNAKAAGKYKYVMDVDGNGWSGRFKRLITSNALVFKATIYPEWYTDRIAPWVHYVPVQNDLSDLHDCLLFFRGDAMGNGAHETLGRKIAESGREWGKTFWRREDLIAYFFRLILEYARLMSEDRDAMSYLE